MGYVALPNDGFHEWMTQRASRVTATDIGKIRTGSDKAFAALWKYKHEPVRQFTNKWIKHGKAREPIIATYALGEYPELLHNTMFLVQEDDARFGATPDMLAEDGHSVGEIKTHLIKSDAERWTNWADVCKSKPEYRAQVQFQLFVTGADYCVFFWEDYSDEDGWFDLRDIRREVVYPDAEYIDKLHSIAESYLAWQPPKLNVGDSGDFEIQAMIQRLGEIESEMREARAWLRDLDGDRKAAQADLLDLMGGKPGLTEYPNGIVDVVPGRRTNSFDRKALAADYPELDEKYTIKKDGAPSVKVTLKENE